MAENNTLDESRLVEALGMSKSFAGNLVLNKVDLSLLQGEVHAIVGENGAGKSTLIKLLSGVLSPDSGRIMIDGEVVHLHSPRDAIRRGVSVIHQEFSLSPHLSVEENVFLGHFPTKKYGAVDHKEMRDRTVSLLNRLSVDVAPSSLVSQLSVAEQQMVEIAKALSFDAKILILDEPTAVLDKDSVEVLFGVVRRLRDEGMGIVYISHHLEEIFDIADRVTVLRDGEVTGTERVANVDEKWLVKHMIGREFTGHASGEKSYGDEALRVEGITADGAFADVSFFVRRGEILGFAGLVGAGRSEIAQAIFGLRRLHSGSIQVFGKECTIRSPRDAIRLGIGYVTEDRKTEGLFLNRPVMDNLTMSSLPRVTDFLFLSTKKEQTLGRSLVGTLDIRLASTNSDVAMLSGGNQQKVLIGRSLAAEPQILLLDEPTRGIDIGAKEEIYRFIEELIAGGMAIVLISSELEEVLRLSDRIVVLRKGRIVKHLERHEASKEVIMNAAALSAVE